MSIEQIVEIDSRYSYRGVYFVHKGLGEVVSRIHGCELARPTHITGQQLSLGLAEYAKEKWGFLAGLVLNSFGIKTTRDYGEIVYLLIEHGWMHAQPEDTIEDFDDVYDFEEVFDKGFSFSKN